MRQIRIIRILFALMLVFAAGTFWAGFYYGQNRGEQEQILTASDHTYDILQEQEESSQSETADTAAAGSVQKDAGNEDDAKVSYYLKQSGEYLSVYEQGTDRVYFETAIRPEDLPEDLQKKAREGILFSDLEELYSFLENYSS